MLITNSMQTSTAMSVNSRWVEAIRMSKKTSQEIDLSITGTGKNISKIVQLYDTNKDELKAKMLEDFNNSLPKEDVYL